MVDTGRSYQTLQEVVALETGRLVRDSFTLALERQYTLNKPRSLIELVAQLTGSVDDQLDTFILNNNLSGSEIIELPAGRTVKYVVQS